MKLKNHFFGLTLFAAISLFDAANSTPLFALEGLVKIDTVSLVNEELNKYETSDGKLSFYAPSNVKLSTKKRSFPYNKISATEWLVKGERSGLTVELYKVNFARRFTEEERKIVLGYYMAGTEFFDHYETYGFHAKGRSLSRRSTVVMRLLTDGKTIYINRVTVPINSNVIEQGLAVRLTNLTNLKNR